jgi:hypothetical protein
MRDIDAKLIRNVLGALNCIDYGDVEKSTLPYGDWLNFTAQPARVFPRLNDDQQDAIAALISRRLTKEAV